MLQIESRATNEHCPSASIRPIYAMKYRGAVVFLQKASNLLEPSPIWNRAHFALEASITSQNHHG